MVWLAGLEFVPRLFIRDNLTLDVLNRLAPRTAVEAWQAGG